jgi:Uma2 family endonuclease
MTLHHPPVTIRPAKLTADDFMLLDRSGAFKGQAKAELIDGTIFVMNAAYSRHSAMQRALFLALHNACRAGPPGLEAYFELTVTLPPRSVVVPDLVIARDVPADGPLTIAGLLLAAEVSASTIDYDLGVKTALYAREAVPEYWVADTGGECLYQFWQPGPDGYAERREHRFGVRIEAATLPIAIDLPAF